ncbi:hypothetical protein ACIRPH_00700 [Nocardiopsis sp. NPDC101807]|uniref:hypothetical protein n=1 Tax=Nocardiopsis sp. NPDC101807 TaxID=3364339 RepID=UPI0038195331
MIVVAAGGRVLCGGGLHACLLLLFPWSISSDIRPAMAFAILSAVYGALLLITTLPSLVAFAIEVRRRVPRGGSRKFGATRATSASVAGLFYFALPFSLVSIEGFTALNVTVSLVGFAVGFLLHRMFLWLSFEGSSRTAFFPLLALAAPFPLLLLRTWPF